MKYGDRVIVKGIADPLRIVAILDYGGNAQFYQAIHDDPEWTPPKGYEVNTNFGQPRICFENKDIIGLVV